MSIPDRVLSLRGSIGNIHKACDLLVEGFDEIESLSDIEADRRNSLRDEINYLTGEADEDFSELRYEILNAAHDLPAELIPNPVRPTVDEIVKIFRFLIVKIK